MAVSVVMPALEMAQETGKVVSWRKKEGERVTKGEPLLEVETDKAVVEVESPGDGILAGVKAEAGAVVPVGQTIGWLVEDGEAPPAEAAPAQTGRRTDSQAARPAPVNAGAAAQSSPSEVRISPKARRLAREHGVDISRLRGLGPGGEVLASDILAAAGTPGAAAAASAPSSASADQPLGAVGRLMAERTTQSWTSVPHFFVTREVDASALVAAHRERAAAAETSGGVKPTLTDLLIALVARTLVKHPRLNASWTGQGIRQHAEVNIGVAMAVDEGVVVAAIRNAAAASLESIAAARRELTERARAGRLQPADIAGATFTISNLGMYGVDAFTAIIVPPQAGILAVARIADRVVAVGGHPAVRPMLTLTLSCDHRVADGARGALFLNDLAEGILEPNKRLS
jgi:pyruvate dehydrogenase E2 component (dihydrolipoyllysine-residue acetyltransferase)